MGATQEEPLLLPRHSDNRAVTDGDRPFSIAECCGSCFLLFLFVAALFGPLIGVILNNRYERWPPEFSVVITAVLGLDVPAGAAASMLDLVFNLTVGITSVSLYEECVVDATTVRVSYLGVPLANGRMPRLCAAPQGGHGEGTTMARGKAVPVPGFMLESLSDNVRTGDAVFDVTLVSPYKGAYWNGTAKIIEAQRQVADGDKEVDPDCRAAVHVETTHNADQ